MLLVPILFFIWLLALMDVLKINTSDTVMLVYTAIFSLQVRFLIPSVTKEEYYCLLDSNE